MPRQGCTLIAPAPALGVLLQDTQVPLGPVVVVLQVTQVRISQTLTVSGTDSGDVNKVAQPAELTPEIPVFEHGQIHIKASPGYTHRMKTK